MILLGIKIMNFNKVKNCNGKYTKCKCSMLYLAQMMIVNCGVHALGNYKINNKLGIELVIIAVSIKIRNHLIS